MDDYGNAIVVTGTAAPLKYSCRSVSPPSSVSSSCWPPPPPPTPPPAVQVVVGNVAPTVVLSPCAACKILRRRCADGCVLAPYFPPTEPAKFTTAHRVFGASNIIKLLQVCVRACGFDSFLPRSIGNNVCAVGSTCTARARAHVR
jgi:hypothetical protein